MAVSHIADGHFSSIDAHLSPVILSWGTGGMMMGRTWWGATGVVADSFTFVLFLRFFLLFNINLIREELWEVTADGRHLGRYLYIACR